MIRPQIVGEPVRWRASTAVLVSRPRCVRVSRLVDAQRAVSQSGGRVKRHKGASAVLGSPQVEHLASTGGT
ncbi:MAG: hypothetical protein ACREPR_13290, partial [Brasilonema sp.]